MVYVIKRDGRQEAVHFDKITARLKKLSYGLNAEHCDPVLVAQKVCAGVYKGVTTSQLDELAAQTAAALTANHPDYALLAARIVVSNLHKNTKKSFSETIKLMYNHVNEKSGQKSPLIADDVFDIVMKNDHRLDSEIIYDRDFDYDYFGFKTLERSYLLRVNGEVVERPQHMLMRVAIGIHKEDINSVIKTYHMTSQRWFTHASPTLFNGGTPKPQLSSCFLLCMKDDSIEGIYDTLKECAIISKSAGGIGVSISNIRSTNSYIRGTNGTSNGIVPMLRVFNDTARYVDQGGGKRKGAFAIYLEPWHADVFDWLDLRKNHGKGVLQPDMWQVVPSDRWDWQALRKLISSHGVRNSLLMAPMPTASTSQILGNNECFEPYTSNMYSRRVLSGEYVVVNKHLLNDLTNMEIWTLDLKNTIIHHNGSIQKIPQIPNDLKAIYRTVWEIKQRTVVDMAADRGCFIDQSQSLNIHMDQPNFGKLTSLHFYTWSKGLKTGMYYLRSKAAADAIKFTVDTSKIKDEEASNPLVEDVEIKMSQMVCSLENRDECIACGS
ncbi:hypothetical protein L7F22_012363 [Adiantum nelumboides]|nr:hypothetical protein [Adiantum nelumboides]